MRTTPAATASDRGHLALRATAGRLDEPRDGPPPRFSPSPAASIYWALGGNWGAASAYGSTDLPPRTIVAVVAALIAGAGAVVLPRIGALKTRLPARPLRLGPWALVAIFGLVGIGNLMAPEGSYARDWHVSFFGPLLLIVAFLCAVVARSPIRGAPRR